MPLTRRTLGLAALVAAGVAAGVAAERAAIGRRLAGDASPEPFGLLRGEAVEVFAEDGVPLHVEVDEPDRRDATDRPRMTVVFVHGYGLSQDCFHYQRAALRGHYRLVFADQRGHGRSGRGSADRSTIDQLGHDLKSIIEAVVPTGPIVLVGHSMGGMTILTLAGQDPDLFRRRIVGVALLATSSGAKLRRSDPGRPDPRRAVNKAFFRVAPVALGAAVRRQRMVEAARRQASDLVFALTNRYSFGSPVSPALTKFVADMVAGTPVDVIAEYLGAFEIYHRADAVAVLEDIETLIMVGDRDRVTPPPHSVEIVRRAPHAEFVLLPRTGHMLMLERYPEVDFHLRELLDRVEVRLATDAPDPS